MIALRRLVGSLTFALLTVPLLSACSQQSEPTTSPSPTTPPYSASSAPTATAVALTPTSLQSIAQARIFFAHRSVGANILEMGIPQVYRAAGVTPPTVTDGMPAESGSIGDHWLDQTEDPLSKLRDFDAWMRAKGVGSATDIALMKFGYVDILKSTDVGSLFDDYKATLEKLEKDFPQVRFIHVTVSMTRWDAENNAAIERFNQLLRNEYGQSGRLFDLALTLSTCRNGERERLETETGRPYFQLCEEYTSDGGHLSDLGAKVAATAMLEELAGVLATR